MINSKCAGETEANILGPAIIRVVRATYIGVCTFYVTDFETFLFIPIVDLYC
jgi:hypothetical protein